MPTEDNNDGLVVAVDENARATTITFKGTSDSREPGAFLNPLIDRVVRDLKTATLVVDFRDLEYMNSATVSSVMRLVKILDAKKIETRLRYKTGVEWQRISIQCMKVIARSLKHLHVDVQG